MTALTAAEQARASLEQVEAARDRLSRTVGKQVPNEAPPLTDYDKTFIGGPVRITLYPISAYNLREQLDVVIGELQKAREATYPQPKTDEAHLLSFAPAGTSALRQERLRTLRQS